MLARAKRYLEPCTHPDTEEKIIHYYSTAKTITQQVFTSQQAQNFFSGFKQIIYYLPESLLTIKKSANTRNVVTHVLTKNAVYAGTAIAYWGYARPFLRSLLNDENSYREQAADYVFSFYLLRQSWRIVVENILHNVSLSKAAASMVPESKHFQPCGHGAVLILRANIIDSNLYSIANQGFLQLIHEIPKLGPLLYWLLMPIQCGQELTEYRLVRQCMKDRREIQRRINAYNAGVGFAPTLATFLASWLVSRYTGVNSLYINHALQNIFIKFSMLASMLQDEQLPTNEPGIDLFRYPQLLTDAIVKDTIELIAPALKEQRNVSNSYTIIKEGLSISARVSLGKAYSRLDSLGNVPAVKLFIELYKTEITRGLRYISRLHKFPSLQLAAFSPEIFLPNGVTSKDISISLDALYAQYTREIVADLKRMMKCLGREPLSVNWVEVSIPTNRPRTSVSVAIAPTTTHLANTSPQLASKTKESVDDWVEIPSPPAGQTARIINASKELSTRVNEDHFNHHSYAALQRTSLFNPSTQPTKKPLEAKKPGRHLLST